MCKCHDWVVIKRTLEVFKNPVAWSSAWNYPTLASPVLFCFLYFSLFFSHDPAFIMLFTLVYWALPVLYFVRVFKEASIFGGCMTTGHSGLVCFCRFFWHGQCFAVCALCQPSVWCRHHISYQLCGLSHSQWQVRGSWSVFSESSVLSKNFDWLEWVEAWWGCPEVGIEWPPKLCINWSTVLKDCHGNKVQVVAD